MSKESPLTAAELKAIGERVERHNTDMDSSSVFRDRARLHTALVWLIDVIVKEANDPIKHPGWWINIGGEHWDDPFATKADATDALLGQGGGE